jgi:hypothetical protein
LPPAVAVTIALLKLSSVTSYCRSNRHKQQVHRSGTEGRSHYKFKATWIFVDIFILLSIDARKQIVVANPMNAPENTNGRAGSIWISPAHSSDFAKIKKSVEEARGKKGGKSIHVQDILGGQP